MMEPATEVLLIAMAVLAAIATVCIGVGALMNKSPSMMHENEPEYPTERKQ